MNEIKQLSLLSLRLAESLVSYLRHVSPLTVILLLQANCLNKHSVRIITSFSEENSFFWWYVRMFDSFISTFVLNIFLSRSILEYISRRWKENVKIIECNICLVFLSKNLTKVYQICHSTHYSIIQFWGFFFFMFCFEVLVSLFTY